METECIHIRVILFDEMRAIRGHIRPDDRPNLRRRTEEFMLTSITIQIYQPIP
jgi:hypothetical protein